MKPDNEGEIVKYGKNQYIRFLKKMLAFLKDDGIRAKYTASSFSYDS